MSTNQSAASDAWSVDAPCKVNLGLKILGKRPDGYHELDTVFHAIDLADTLTLRQSTDSGRDSRRVDLSLVLPGAEARGGSGGPPASTGLPVAGGEDNLVVRAARAFLDRVGEHMPRGALEFRLRKRVPAGGGLGGGSSDAAAALRLLNRHVAETVGPASCVSSQDLHEIAASLGADVPFFLAGQTQRGLGTGTTLTPLQSPSLWFWLVLPPYGTSTVRVYENYEPHWNGAAPLSTIGRAESRVDPDPSLADMLETSTTIESLGALANDLEPAAMRGYPPLAALRDALARTEPGIRLSGSGSTMFAAYLDEASWRQAEAGIRQCCVLHGARVVAARSARHLAPHPVVWGGESSARHE